MKRLMERLMTNNEKTMKKIMKIRYPLNFIIFHYSKKIMTNNDILICWWHLASKCHYELPQVNWSTPLSPGRAGSAGGSGPGPVQAAPIIRVIPGCNQHPDTDTEAWAAAAARERQACGLGRGTQARCRGSGCSWNPGSP
jgi:hypothetical protein